jgi:hypothetical protein
MVIEIHQGQQGCQDDDQGSFWVKFDTENGHETLLYKSAMIQANGKLGKEFTNLLIRFIIQPSQAFCEQGARDGWSVP